MHSTKRKAGTKATAITIKLQLQHITLLKSEFQGPLLLIKLLLVSIHIHVEHGGSVVSLVPCVRRVMGSNRTLAAT